MKILDILEAIAPMGSTTDLGATPPATPGQPQMTGSTQQPGDPRMQAVQLAKQKQERDQQKRDVMAQIKAKQAELQALQKQQTELNKNV